MPETLSVGLFEWLLVFVTVFVVVGLAVGYATIEALAWLMDRRRR